MKTGKIHLLCLGKETLQIDVKINAKSEKRNDFGKKMIRRGQFNLLNGANKSKKLIYEIHSKHLTNIMRWIE